MGYRPRLADIACPRASNFADVHPAVGTGVTAGVRHDATRSTPRPHRTSPQMSGYPDGMNHIRAITTRIIIAASVALCAIVVVPDLTFAAPD